MNHKIKGAVLVLGCFCVKMIKSSTSLRTMINDANHAQQRRHPGHGTQKSEHLFEGDLVPVYDQIMQTYGSKVTEELVRNGILEEEDESGATGDLDSTRTRNTIPLDFHIWPDRVNDVAEIPYDFDKFFVGNRTVVAEALRDLEHGSGVVRFVQTTNTPHYLRLVSKDRGEQDAEISENPPCWSYVGFQNKKEQDLNLGKGCVVPEIPGIIQHEVLHALGFWHPNSRYDRNDYVTIEWENITSGLYFERRIVDDTLGLPYDYASIMHYGATDYSNGGITMVAPEPIGQLDGPSQGDLVHLRLLYQCQSGPRSFADYVANPCTPDCKCWEMSPGSCHGDDNACQGDLICARHTNQCTRQRLVAVAGSRKKSSMLVLVLVVGGAASGGLALLRLYHARRRQSYQPIY